MKGFEDEHFIEIGVVKIRHAPFVVVIVEVFGIGWVAPVTTHIAYRTFLKMIITWRLDLR